MKRIILVLIAAMITVSLCACTGNAPTDTTSSASTERDIIMYGARVTSTGEVTESINFNIHCTKERDAAADMPLALYCSISFPDVENPPILNNTYGGAGYYTSDTDYYSLSGFSYWAEEEDFVKSQLLLNGTLTACVLVLENEAIFVGSTAPNFDALAILDRFAEELEGVYTPVDTEGKFNMKMYGAEVDAEGAVIRELEFELSGQIITDEGGHTSIRLEPIVLDDMTICLNYEPEYCPTLHDELSETGYYAVWISYLADLNRYATIQMGLSRSLDSCLLMVEDMHYFIGSTDPDFDPQTVFHQFDYINR